ncbi:MAG: CRISPR-associated endoribonuclease Cas6 [Lewinellaceae bacterium]|nr:CRISPR-associated endoribonuclease Cas6 [Lewinellaceae bacterium]
MQFKVTFGVKKPGQLLPLSYQYELSSWIYKLIGSSDSEFGEFLHEKGYTSGNKRFKLFTFSNLYVPPRFEILGDRMKVYSRDISFVVSFLVEEAAQGMILGLFKEQELRLGDRISQLELAVQQVEALRPPEIKGRAARLRATSPILASEPEAREGGKLWHNYLHPADKQYEQYFFKNLRDKYEAALVHQLVEPIDMDQPMAFRLLSKKAKKRGIRIKAFTPAETKVIGYLYDFEITAPPELTRLGMMAGFGGENALGFGATKLME